MKLLSVVLFTAAYAAGQQWGKGTRWNRRRAKKQAQNGLIGLARSGQTSFWTPCEKGKISLTRPKRLTRVEECMIDKYNVGIPVIKCLNWKTMAQSNARDCIAECQRTLQRAKKWPAKKKVCENAIANQEDKSERGGCKKGKKCKNSKGKGKDEDNDDEEDESLVLPTTETLDTENGLMFDDDFDSTTEAGPAPDRLSMSMEAPLFDDFSEDSEKPLFEDFSEDGGLGLFDDSVNETKSDSQARLELEELTPEPTSPPTPKPKGGKPKGGKRGKGKKGKKPVSGRRG